MFVTSNSLNSYSKPATNSQLSLENLCGFSQRLLTQFLDMFCPFKALRKEQGNKQTTCQLGLTD